MPVTLRPACSEDREPLLALVADPAVARSLSPVALASLGEALDRVLAGARDEGARVIEEAGRAGPAGVVRWRTLNPRNRIAAVVGLAIDPSCAGRGVASAALRALADELLGPGPERFHRLEAEAYAFNQAGVRAFERAGFSRDGLRRRAWWRDGAWHDGVLLGRVAED